MCSHSRPGTPKHVAATVNTGDAGNGGDGVEDLGVLELAGAKAIRISTARVAVGFMFQFGVMGTG